MSTSSTVSDDKTSTDPSLPTVGKKTTQDEKQTNDKKATIGTEDSELDAILDSALADFDKADEPNPVSSASCANDASGKMGGDAAEGDNSGTADELNYDFLADAMTKQFEECFSSLIKDPEVKKQFEELSKSAEEAATTNNPTAFAETVEKALSGMSLNAENLQNEANSQQDLWEELAQSLAGGGQGPGGMAGSGGGGPGPDIMGGLPSMEGLGGLGAMGGMFQSMVQQLLSKELLYQPLKEVAVKYHEYLDKNKDILGADTLSNYTKQLEIVEKVVEHLDGDSDDHSPEEKNARFEVLLDLLQKMHELGNPPKEVVGEGNMMMANLPDLAGMGGFPGLPGGPEGGADPSQCVVM